MILALLLAAATPAAAPVATVAAAQPAAKPADPFAGDRSRYNACLAVARSEPRNR